MKICVVDFDETLLEIDSVAYILTKERLFLYPKVLFWGGILFLFKPLLSKSRQIYLRRKLKFSIMNAIDSIGLEKVFNKYAKLLSQYLNDKLADFLLANYDRIYVVSSSFQDLIQMILKEGNMKNLQVFGTVFTPEFKDFSICWNVNKIDVIEKNNIKNFDLYTDSYDDKPLMARAKNTFLVKKSKWTKL